MAQLAEKRETKPVQIKDAAFKWDDPLDLEGELTEEERMVRDTARDYAQEKLFPRVVTAYREEKYDPAVMREMGELGLLGATIPEEYGGAGLSYVAYGLIAREIERVDSGFRSAHVGAVVAGDASDLRLWQRSAAAQISAQARQRRIRRLLRPDRARPRLRSRLDDDARREGRRRLQLTGAKTWITNAPVADVAVVWAKLDGKIRGFIVERGTKGFSTPKIEGKLSLRASITGEIVLDGAVVPEENLLPNVAGLAGPFGCLNVARARHCLGRDGRGGILLAPRPRLRARPQAVRPPARRQPADPEKARRHADRNRARPAGRHCGSARLIEQGKAAPPAISLIKRNNCGKALDIARLARDMHGGNGIADEYPRHARAVQPGNRQHLRRHPRHPRADPRPRADRHPGVYVSPS